MACACIKQEIPGGKGNVKGFVTVSECVECAQKRAAALIQAEIEAEYQMTNTLIIKKSHELAVEQLKKEGKIDSSGNITQSGKDSLKG